MIRVAIIGTGAISSQHIEGYLKNQGRCKITALVDIYKEKAEQKALDYELEDIYIYQDYRELLIRDDIDLVSICTPPYLHAKISIDCMKSGMNVLCEKPMAASLQECDEMIKAAEETKQMLSIVSQNRFRNPIMKLKSVLDAGLIGKILWTEVDSYWWRGHCYYDLWWRGTWEKESGGCTLNHAVHHIDMMNWMMKEMPEKVTAVLQNVAHDNSEVEDISLAALQYKNGAMGRLTSSVIHHGQSQKLEFQGEKAKIADPFHVYASVSKSSGFPERNEELEARITKYYQELPDLVYEGHAGQIDNVLMALARGTLPLVTGEDGRNTIELITAVYKAGFEESTVKLPVGKEEPWYTAEGILSQVRHFYEKSTFIENFKSISKEEGTDDPNRS